MNLPPVHIERIRNSATPSQRPGFFTSWQFFPATSRFGSFAFLPAAVTVSVLLPLLKN